MSFCSGHLPAVVWILKKIQKVIDMKTGVTLFLLVFFLAACEASSKNPLSGRWQSDEQATLAEARSAGGLTDQQIQQLDQENIFGRLVADIDNEQIVFTFNGKSEASPYRILKIEKPFVDIELLNAATGQYETTRIEVRGNRMWVPSAMASFREVFVRVP